MRACGDCTLCCKLPRIEELLKPSWQWCRHCDVGRGCKIYERKPDVCSDFSCNWLIDKAIPDHLRPDRIHMYAQWKPGDQVVRVMVDNDFPEAIDTLEGRQFIEGYRARNHVLLVTKDIVRFLCGYGRDKPAKMQLDWIL